MENAVPNPHHSGVHTADMNAAVTLGAKQNSRDSGVVVQPHLLWSQPCPLCGHRVADATREKNKGISSDHVMRGILRPRHELLDFRPSMHAWRPES